MTLPFTVHSIKKCSCHPRLLLLITSTILREWLSGTEGNRWLKWILIPTSYNPRLLFWLAKPADRIISLPSTLFLNQLNRWHFRNVTSNPIMLFILIKLCIRANFLSGLFIHSGNVGSLFSSCFADDFRKLSCSLFPRINILLQRFRYWDFRCFFPDSSESGKNIT